MTCLALFCALVLTGVALAQGPQQHRLPWRVVSTGGGRMASNRYGLDGSVGQPAIGLTAGGAHHLGAGYWYGIVSVGPGIKVYLPLVTRNQ